MSSIRLALVCLAATALGGCTLLNLDGFELPRCNISGEGPTPINNQRCADALNELNGFPAPDICRPYFCNFDGFCQLAAGERCDAFDNDCDGLVDEGTQPRFNPELVGMASDTFRTGHTGMDLASVSVVPGLSDVTVTFTDIDDDAWSFALGDMAEDFVYGHNMVNQPWPVGTERLERESCWRQSFAGAGAGAGGAPEFTTTNCSFAAIATDRVQGVGLIAAINTRAGCVDGQLRIGHTTAEEPDVFQNNGPWERSNSFLGIGLTSDGRCTATQPAGCRAAIERTQTEDVCAPECGAGEACFGGTCTAASSCSTDAECGPGRCLCGTCVSAASFDRAQLCGVSGVNIAATEPERDQARGVVAFTSGSREATCANFERDVAVIGASLLDSAGGTSFQFVTTTNEAQPQVLGQTRAAAAPAVYGLEDQFVVAYPTTESDALSIHVVDGLPPLIAAMPSFSTATCETLTGEEQMCAGDLQPVCGLTDCGSDVGVCASGARACFRGEGICDGHVAGTDEVCANGVDEDCDGIIDEDPSARPCLADCVAAAETCNARDDDCDGMVDEDTEGAACGGAPGADPEVGVCTQGAEVCRGGKLLCMGSIDPSRNAAGNGREYTTPVVAGFPYGVGLDDDCDGNVDEDVGMDGLVADCTPDPMRPEVCNGRDDDGDCAIDEDSPRLQLEDFLDTPVTERPREVVRQCVEEPAFPALPATVVEGGLGFGLMDDVVVAGTTFARGNELALGVTWRETSESDPTQRRIGFRVLRFETECECLMPGRDAMGNPMAQCSDAVCSESTIGQIAFVGATDPVEVTTAPGSYGAPHVSYTPRGVIVAGTMRSGRPVTRDGGFVVTYTQPASGDDGVFRNAAMVRVFAEHDGLARDPDCTANCSANITVTGLEGAMRGVPDVDYPRSYFDRQLQETRYLYFDNRNREFISYGFECTEE